MVGHQGADRGQVHLRRHPWPAASCSGERSRAEWEGDPWTDAPVDQHLRGSDSGSVLGATSLGLHGLPMRRRKWRQLKNVPTTEDLLSRNFRAPAMNRVWLTDITEHKTREHPVLLCRPGPLFAPGGGLGDRQT